MLGTLTRPFTWLVVVGSLRCIKSEGADNGPTEATATTTGSCGPTVEMTISFDGDDGFKKFKEHMRNADNIISIDAYYDDATPPPCENNSTDDGCFWISATGERNMTYDDGVKKCNEGKSYVAVVKNQNDYDVIMKMLRKHWKVNEKENTTYANAWINGTIDPKDAPGNREQHPYIKWYPTDYPKTERKRTHLTLYVDKKGDTNEGMLNQSPSSGLLAVACYFVPL